MELVDQYYFQSQEENDECYARDSAKREMYQVEDGSGFSFEEEFKEKGECEKRDDAQHEGVQAVFSKGAVHKDKGTEKEVYGSIKCSPEKGFE